MLDAFMDLSSSEELMDPEPAQNKAKKGGPGSTTTIFKIENNNVFNYA